MAFAIEASALHRPLGFEFSADRAVVLAPRAPAERGAFERDGASAAAILPPDAIAGAGSRELRARLARAGGVLREMELPPEPRVVASARGVVDGHRVSVLGFASGTLVPPERSALKATLFTDAQLPPSVLEKLLNELAARTFATIAGVESPRPDDAILALASGAAGAADLEPDSIGATTLLVGSVAMAQKLVRRLLEETFAPEPARVVQVTVSGASDVERATRACEALASDAALRDSMEHGAHDRGLCAAALASPISHADWSARDAQAALRIDLGAGRAMATRWTAVRYRDSSRGLSARLT